MNRQLLKAQSYDKVLINAANKHVLQRNENEYISALYDVPSETRDGTNETAMIDPGCLRKINLLTAKERPLCSVCQTKVGFTWYESTEHVSCDQCFKTGDL